MTLGDYIKEKRKDAKLSRNALGLKAGISHTEIFRIENNERKQPSLKVLCSLADALMVPQEELLKIAGYSPSDDISPIERAFPGLQSEKQIETMGKIADGLSRNSDLEDEDLDDLYQQVEMFLDYVKRKKDSDKTKI